MGLSPDALYSAVLSDLKVNLPLGPVAPSSLPPDVSYKEFVSTSLVYDVTRKWVPENSREADDLSYEKFIASNKKCSNWRLDLKDSGDEQLWGEFLLEIDSFLHPLGNQLVASYFDIFEKGRTGPGSSIGATGNSMYAKLFSSVLTTTSEGLYKMYKSYVECYPLVDEAECLRLSTYGSHRVTTSSRCSFVPKTRDVSRMICVEPSVNMFCQLGLGALLEDRLKSSFSLDLSSQPLRNRQLAHRGSVDGFISTIDLSSASDSLSLKLCESIFPDWFFRTLLELRSPSTTYKGCIVPLNMISTMGNGFTFPLQTLIFSCLIRAAYTVSGFPIFDGEMCNWSCFGDDLVVNVKCVRNVFRLLDLIGCTTNSSKTFTEGPFRESCGADWFFGQPARSVFIKRLRSPQDIFVAINLLNGWSAYTGVSLSGSISYLIGGLSPSNKTCFVPYDENNDAGIRVPSTFITWIPRRSLDTGSILYYRFMAMPKKIRIGEGEFRYPRCVKKPLMYNPAGLLLSLLYGELVACSISVRLDRILYTRKLRCTPWWDYMPSDSLINGFKLSWQQWETAVLTNVSSP